MPGPPEARPPEPLPGLTVGVFDSGVGGLSVLTALREHLPQARWVYVADSANAPYGERDEAWLQQRCLRLSHFLCLRGAKVLVVACNTATAATLPALRQAFPEVPIVGVEPGIKPAVLQSNSKRVGVWATGATLRSPRWAALLAEHGRGAQVYAQACNGLAWAIEQGDISAIQALVEQYTLPMRQARVDSLVLGCTHYAFARPWIEEAMGAEVMAMPCNTGRCRPRCAPTRRQPTAGPARPPGTRGGRGAASRARRPAARQRWQGAQGGTPRFRSTPRRRGRPRPAASTGPALLRMAKPRAGAPRQRLCTHRPRFA